MDCVVGSVGCDRLETEIDAIGDRLCRWGNSSPVLYAGTYSSDLGDGIVVTAFHTDNTATMWRDRTKPNFALGSPAYLDYNA